jgi:hypothetical protein
LSDIVNHPPHYKANGIEAIDVIESFGLDQSFALGNAVKYLLRAGRKGDGLTDLRKARWYLERKIAQLESGETEQPHAPLYYLATPYSKYQGGNLEAAFVAASKIAADLLVVGYRVYSPIAHTHPLAIHSGLDPLDHSIWMPFDEAIMDAADALMVAQMEGWRESFGINHEIEFFKAARKPIVYLDCVTMRVSEAPNVIAFDNVAPAVGLVSAHVEDRGVIS